jgi:hypothetical protein
VWSGLVRYCCNVPLRFSRHLGLGSSKAYLVNGCVCVVLGTGARRAGVKLVVMPALVIFAYWYRKAMCPLHEGHFTEPVWRMTACRRMKAR